MSGPGGVQQRWSQALPSSHEVGRNKRSPFVNKCLVRAKAGRESNLRKLRAGMEVGYGYAELASEIMKDIRAYASGSMEDCNFEEEFLYEVSEAIRLEYELSEYLNFEHEEEELDMMLQSQIEMSEIPDEMLLLCPFCRKSAMTFTEQGDGMHCLCSCSKSICLPRGTNSLSVNQLRDMLAAVFERHKLVCCGGGTNSDIHSDKVAAISSSGIDSYLCFDQIQGNLYVHCTVCGFNDVIILALLFKKTN